MHLKIARVRSQWSEPVELVYHNVIRSRSFFYNSGLRSRNRTRLRLRQLRFQQLLVGVELLLPADIDLISRAGRIGVKEFAVVLDRGDLVSR